MSRFDHQLGLTAAVLFATALAFMSLAPNVHATIVGAQSTGSDMAGGFVTVSFAQQGSIVAPIVAGVPGQGMALVPGLFEFSVTGDTFLANWELQNLTTFDIIRSAIFDLRPLGPAEPKVLFDDNSLPSTLNGFAGRDGAVQVNVGAPTILVANELVPWGDAMNLGDEFHVEEILYDGFGPGLISVWRDDTDIIGVETPPELPEPASAVLIAIAALAIGQLRSRSM